MVAYIYLMRVRVMNEPSDKQIAPSEVVAVPLLVAVLFRE